MRTPEVTSKMYAHFMRTAKRWLKDTTDYFSVEDAINDGICAALEINNPKPDDVSWQQHMTFHIIRGIRRFTYDLQSPTHPRHCNIDWFETIPEYQQPDPSTQEQREYREQRVQMVMQAMKPASRRLLLEIINWKVPFKQLEKKYGVQRAALVYRLKQAKGEFIRIATELDFVDDSAQAIDSGYVVNENMSPVQYQHPIDEFHGWYKTDCTTPKGVFQEESGKEIVLSDQQIELKERCQRLRSQRIRLEAV